MSAGDSRESRTFLISVAAELAGMHAQTLRTYDRLGLVSPRAVPVGTALFGA
jgi:MerR family transcriptional regulator/heat shock protein HspR